MDYIVIVPVLLCLKHCGIGGCCISRTYFCRNVIECECHLYGIGTTMIGPRSGCCLRRLAESLFFVSNDSVSFFLWALLHYVYKTK